MNSKILIAFVSGAVLALGIVFLAVRQETEPKPRVPVVASAKPTPHETLPAAAPTARAAPMTTAAPPTSPKVTAPAPAPPRFSPPVRERLSRTPVREKPSPLTPHVRREEPVTVARDEKPAAPVAPEPPQLAVGQLTDPGPPVAAQIPSQRQPPAPEPAPENVAPPQPAPSDQTPPTVTIAAGTILPVRIGETISAAHYQAGDTFLATLDRQLVVDGWIIADRGSRLEGRVVQSIAGHSGGASHLEVELVKLSTADGQHVQIRTQPYKKDATNSPGNDVAKVATGAALGTIIGAAAGGGKGAAIGAGVGTAAGVAGVVFTHGRPAEIPVETRISFRISDPVTITERLN